MSQPSELSARHRSVAAYEATGVPVKRLAELCDYSPATISEIRRSPLYKALVEQYRSEFLGDKLEAAAKRLAAEILNSVDTLVELRDEAEDDSIRLRAVENILDRGGLPRATKAQSQIEVAHVFSDEEVARMYQELSVLRESLEESEELLRATADFEIDEESSEE